VFVEVGPAAAAALSENLGMVTDASSARVIRSDWRLALRRLAPRADGGPGGLTDVAFVDPPYGADYYDEVMKTFLDYGIISDGGIVVLERPSPGNNARGGGGRRARDIANGKIITGTSSLAGPYGGFSLLRERRYGKTVIEFYGRTGP
jgi:16S rRNA G966 N2-methylase RsmD